MIDREQIATYLDLMAAQAKTLSRDVRDGRLWNGDLNKGLREIREALDKAQNAARDDR